jgi:hypothetical protein
MLRNQLFFKLTLGLIISALVLTACGGDAPPATNEPEETMSFLATDAPIIEPTITPSPVQSPPTVVPLDVQLGDLPAGKYSLSMLGALNSDIGFTPFDKGLRGADYKLAANGTNLDGPYEFMLWTDILTDGTTDDTTAQVVFTFPASVEAGTYEVVGRDAMVNPTDIGIEIITGFQSQRFGTNATGTINVVANGGVGGVFSGEFEVTVGDEAGNTILATGRASAIGFVPQEAGELVISGALEIAPSPDEVIYTIARDTSSTANNDWRLDMIAINTETNPYIIQHRLYMVPNIAQGTYEIQPRLSPIDSRPEDLDVTAYVELFNPQDGTKIEATDISGTLEVISTRDTFTATFTLTYNIDEGQQVIADGGAFYLYKPAG